MARVLVVDDDPVILRLIARRLTDAGFAVATAETVQGARRQSGPFDLLLVDVLLPDGEGPQVGDAFPEAQMITMSGKGEPDLRKPFSIVGLPDLLMRYLERP